MESSSGLLAVLAALEALLAAEGMVEGDGSGFKWRCGGVVRGVGSG
jgi:hypothetical protein